MENPRRNSNLDQGGTVPHQWGDRAIPDTAGGDVPQPRGQEAPQTVNPEYSLPQDAHDAPTVEVRPLLPDTDQPQEKPKKRFSTGTKIGAAGAALALAGGAFFAGMKSSPGTPEGNVGPVFNATPTASASEVPGSARASAPSTETRTSQSYELLPAGSVSIFNPETGEIKVYDNAEAAEKYGKISRAEAGSVEGAGKKYLQSLAVAANMNVAPKSVVLNGGAKSTIQRNKDTITEGLFASLGKHHNEITEPISDSYMNFGELAWRLNQQNIADHTISVPEFMEQDRTMRGDLKTGAALLGNIRIRRFEVLTGIEKPNPFVVNSEIDMKPVGGYLDFTGTSFAKK